MDADGRHHGECKVVRLSRYYILGVIDSKNECNDRLQSGRKLSSPTTTIVLYSFVREHMILTKGLSVCIHSPVTERKRMIDT